MSDIAIKFENIAKQYRLGIVGTGTISHDLNRWWHLVRGKEDPYLKVGEVNDRSTKASGDYVWALRDINFEVKQGEVLGIIGKNGAGKSTLLKILSRVTSPTSGSIKAKGRIASLLEVGTGFHQELTGRENIYMNGAIMGMTKAEITRKLDEIVDFAGIEKYIDTPVKRYSSGMTVRLGFAIAAHLEPEILVVDEVLAVGDAEFQKKAIKKMQDVSKGEGRTVLFVSHNMNAVRSLCYRGVVLGNGMTEFDGLIEDAINYYAQGQEDRSKLSLEEVERIGDGSLRITDAYFTDIKDERKSNFETGQTMKIVLEYEVQDSFNEQHLSKIDVGINNILGTRVTFLSTSMFTSKVDTTKRKTTFVIDSLMLAEATYNLNIYVESTQGISDYLVNILSFSVVFNDYYGFGNRLPVIQTSGHDVTNYHIQ